MYASHLLASAALLFTALAFPTPALNTVRSSAGYIYKDRITVIQMEIDVGGPAENLTESYFFDISGGDLGDWQCQVDVPESSFKGAIPVPCASNPDIHLFITMGRPLRSEIDGVQPDGTNRNLNLAMVAPDGTVFGLKFHNLFDGSAGTKCSAGGPPFYCSLQEDSEPLFWVGLG